MPTHPKKSLKIAQWNANGLQGKTEELKQFLREFNIDIMAINETKFCEKSKLYIPGFNCYRLDRNPTNRAGGVIILAKSDIDCEEVHFKTANMETIGININSNTTIVSAYLSPKNLHKETELDELYNSGNKVIVIGDLNSKHQSWDCSRRSNKNGRDLFNFLRYKEFVLLAPDRPTHYPYASEHAPSIIDVALVKNIPNCTIEVYNELDSITVF